VTLPEAYVQRDKGFATWLGAATVSTTGDSVSFFALGWVASASGAGAASVVLTAGSIPLCFLILVGGSLADRFGVRSVMVSCDAAMAIVMAALAVGSLVGTPVWLLAAASFLGGTAAALRRPAEGVMPRLFSSGDNLARRMAVVGGAQQLARVTGPVLGGVMVETGGLPLTSAFDTATFVLVLGVLLAVRPPHEALHQLAERGGGWRSIVAGARAARRTPGIPQMLLVVTGMAGTILPFVMLCVPLLGRERGWNAGDVGMASAGWVAGGLVVTLFVARRGAPGRRVAVGGPLVAAAGMLVLAATSSLRAGILATVVVGVGTCLLTAHLYPAYVAASPSDMLARFQSLAGLAQTAPVLVLTPALGGVIAHAGVEVTLVVLAVVLVTTAATQAGVDRPENVAHEDRGRVSVGNP
jgi:MFS family permease